MWMTVLAMNTITAESTIGSQSDAMLIILCPPLAERPVRARLYRETVPRLMRSPRRRRPLPFGAWGAPRKEDYQRPRLRASYCSARGVHAPGGNFPGP